MTKPNRLIRAAIWLSNQYYVSYKGFKGMPKSYQDRHSEAVVLLERKP